MKKKMVVFRVELALVGVARIRVGALQSSYQTSLSSIRFSDLWRQQQQQQRQATSATHTNVLE